jgi:hypothetical protein
LQFERREKQDWASLRAKRSKPFSPGRKGWIASAFAQERFGGLLPREARAASAEGSSLSLRAMTARRVGSATPQHILLHFAAMEMEERYLGKGCSPKVGSRMASTSSQERLRSALLLKFDHRFR